MPGFKYILEYGNVCGNLFGYSNGGFVLESFVLNGVENSNSEKNTELLNS